ncbi:MAG: hypothetical protein BZ138_05830 [Methanosphaera sp. rholeuAM270]|nr:MAG: hypothetical protein BZ138_05830 [Methanosphaera sp. rholeuAM270]
MYFKAGGAIYNQGTITITKTTLNNNNAEYNGGAIYNNDKGIINIIKSTLNNNSASEWGGAISNFYGGTVTINNSTLNNNSASQWGGAIYNEGRLAINNTKLNYNNAEWSGGAIANEGGNCTINNTILNNNNADHGGAIFNYASTCSVINSVLNNNVPFVEVVEKNNIYNIKVIDSNGILFSQNSVLVYLNGVYDGNYTITDNLIRWNKELGNGKYLLSIVTNADNRINYNFKIGIKDTCISLNDIGYAQYSEDVVISGTLKDIDENPISNVSIKLSVNGKIVNAVTNRMGMFSYIFKATSIGLNGVIATYRGDERYSDSTNSTAFNVIPMTTRITLNKINTTKYNRNVTITGKFTDVKGKILGNSNLKVNINGKIYAIKTNTKGIYTFTKKAGNIGTNNVTVSYAGNTKYIGNTTKATFKVTKQNLKITVNAIKVIGYGSNVTITGKFMDATGKLLVNSIIRVNVNGKTYKVKSNSKGIFTKSIKTNKLGTNNVTISYPGNKNYNAISIKKTFKVVKNNVTVTITSAKQVGKTRNITITGKLTDKTGYTLKNSQVTVKINDKTYYAKTNNNGVYSITKTAKKGTNNITVGYAGNKNYNKYTSTTKITIA